ncbi:hypothetical protein [Amycolatopsis sp. NPDC051372]
MVNAVLVLGEHVQKRDLHAVRGSAWWSRLKVVLFDGTARMAHQ